MKNRNLVIVILAVICAGLLAGVVYTVTKGKSGTQKKQEASAEAGADETESQSGIIEEDGKKYKLNPDIKTVLFMGVDKEEKADLGNNPGENGQSDSLNLLVLNKEEKTAQIIQISRDSMVGIDIYDVTGNRLMTENGQIALQYAYGDGAEESCRLTSEKVSELMYGVNVDSYFSLTLEGLVAATDAVGGITLTVPEDYTAVDPAFEKGAEVTLNGELAEKYVRKRDIEVLDSNNQRMERQSQFMDALIEKMQSIQSETEYLSLYQKLEDYMTTNMTADEMEELTDYKVAEDTVKVPGEIIEKDGHAQYLVDNKELKKIKQIMLAINEKDSMILSMKIYEKYIYMKYWDNSGFLARIEDKGITVLLEWDAYLALDICETLNESNKFFLYSRNTGKVWLVDSKREVIDELDLRCSNLRHMLVDNKNENILYELYQQNGSCKVYYQPIGEIDILSSYSLR